jgi:zinc and cadmium transporter
MQLRISFVGGLMRGVSLLHLLPHAVFYTDSLDLAVQWALAGLLVTFFLIRVFQFHQHTTADTSDVQDGHGHVSDVSPAGPGMTHVHTGDGRPGVRWVGVAVGLGLHTLIDGIAVGAGVAAETHAHVFLPGLSIFLVVLLHKPLDALSITSLMAADGWPMQVRQLVNVGFAMMCPLGALLFVLGVGDQHQAVIGSALAFSAGMFLCISLGDLLPEVHFHAHDQLKLSAALLLGIAVAYAVGSLETAGHLGHGAH